MKFEDYQQNMEGPQCESTIYHIEIMIPEPHYIGADGRVYAHPKNPRKRNPSVGKLTSYPLTTIARCNCSHQTELRNFILPLPIEEVKS